MEQDSTITEPNVNPIKESLIDRFKQVRNFSCKLTRPLEIEDYVVQPVVDVSPPKWHLAHTTWFFEELILKGLSDYKEFHPDYSYLFNSYYENVGKRVLRPNRGNMTRPTVDEIYKYREYVDNQMIEFLEGEGDRDEALLSIVELGIQHEQQHQELLVTDIKYILGHNPLFPVYKEKVHGKNGRLSNGSLSIEGGIYEIGYNGNGFSFDNEHSIHKVHLEPFSAMDRMVTAGEYMEFIDDGGYTDFRWWLSEGWDWVNNLEEKAPMYWHKVEADWHHYTLHGFEPVHVNEPVTHISYFEAEAYSHWKGQRLLTEIEWEILANTYGNISPHGFVDQENFHPEVQQTGENQILGFGWEWTRSAYLPYPGFKIAKGALGEYNGKFMINQMVLRGGSCATSMNHIRTTYRNFFHPHLRWQFTGLRLAE